jgi:hypothetical protein
VALRAAASKISALVKALAAHASAALAEADRHVGAADRARRTAEALSATAAAAAVDGEDEGSGTAFGDGGGGGGGVRRGQGLDGWSGGSEISAGFASGSKGSALAPSVSLADSHQRVPIQVAQVPANAGSLRSAGDSSNEDMLTTTCPK